MKHIKTLILAILCLPLGGWGGQTASAAPTFQVGVGILGKINGTQSAYTIGSTYTQGEQVPVNNATSYNFDGEQFNIGSNDVPITVELQGTLIFTNSSSYTDVTTDDFRCILTFTSTTKYFTGASVTTKAGAAVSGCSVSGGNSKTLTVYIPSHTSFGNIILTLATHTPLDYCTISGIADSYINDGVVEPVPTVTVDGQTLRQDVDYTLSYSYGSTTGYVTVTGAGDYIGEKTQSFGIREPNLSDFTSLGTDIYAISSQRDLDYLARIVNGNSGNTGNSCAGKTFRQTADIDYSHTTAWDNLKSQENNFTPIGGYGKSFNGTYDGQGYTISGIRVRAIGSSNADSSKGLFGFVSGGGTVKNVILQDANIQGYQNIGGLVGFIDTGNVTDCYLNQVYVHSSYSNDSQDIIVGNKGGTITRTHYRDCCCETQYVNHNYRYIYTSSIFAVTHDAGVSLPRTDGTIVNPTLTSYTDGITLNGTQYYTPGTVITLSYSGGSEIFTMPDVDVTPLLNGYDNSSIIDALNGQTVNIIFSGRTLQAGGWNTFCAPFSAAIPASWTMKGLDSSSLEGDALTLNFYPSNSIYSLDTIKAGEPYLVKVTSDHVNPLFYDVTVVSGTTTTTTTYADFVPVMSPTSLTGGDQSVLFVSGGNSLTYPTSSGNINAFRAYFQLHDVGSSAKVFNMSFEEDATSIQNAQFIIHNEDDAVFNLAGQRINKMQKGINVVNGKKVIIK
jgi:hypothetical protein